MKESPTPSYIAGRDASMRQAQLEWSALPVSRRLAVFRAARRRMSSETQAFTAAISPELTRSAADTMAAEVLPLLDGCRLLERRAEHILATRHLGKKGLPIWLAGVDSEVQRVPFGKVLVIAPANYPLFIPGVQVLQALAAGNAVVWKPGRGGKRIADVFAEQMYAAGLPRNLLQVTEDTVGAAQGELDAGADKVFFTGSSETGQKLLAQLAQTATPSVMELSGCDAVIVLPSADMARVAQALSFGLRFNGSATCMAPRRLFLSGLSKQDRDLLVSLILEALTPVQGVVLPQAVLQRMAKLLEAAVRDGADMHGELETEQRPLLLSNVTPEMEVAKADLFAPLLMLFETGSEAETMAALGECPYALTVALFGDEREARRLSRRITAGTILVNDLIVPTADPRVPFGGRRQSGFGVTRGAEGLLEMTAVKVISVRRGKSVRHYESTTSEHEALFRGLIAAIHAGEFQERWRGVTQLIAAARRLTK